MRWSLFPYKGSSPTTCSITPASSKKERACSFTPRPRRRVLGRPEMLALDHRACGTAGDVDSLTADVRGLVGDEEGDNVGDVLDAAEAPQGDVLGEPLLHVLHGYPDALGSFPGHLRLDPTRRHRVDVDIEPPELQGQRARHSLQTRLGRGVVDLPLVPQSHDRAGHHDLAVLLLDHVLLDGLGTQETALQVDVQNLVPVVLTHLEEEVVAQETGVVDQDVEPPEVVGDLVERRADLLEARYVARDRDRLLPGVLDGHHRVVTRLRGEVQDGDVGALLRQLYRLRCPNAPPGTSYNRHPSVESTHADHLTSRM